MNKHTVTILVLCTLLTAYLGGSEAGLIRDLDKLSETVGEAVGEALNKGVEVMNGQRGIVIDRNGIRYGYSNQQVIIYSLLGVGAALALLICCCACCQKMRTQTV